MCTSFIFRGEDTLIAMNYDNHGMNFQVEPYREDLFSVTCHNFGRNRPLFGIRNDGVMINQQVINECEAGKFKIGWHVVHTSSLVEKILSKKKSVGDLSRFLEKHEIVNPPQNSLHIMIACPNKESYIIEPGRGIMRYPVTKTYIAMSNCSVYEADKTGVWKGFGVDRQLKVEEVLKTAPHTFSVKDAFKVLESVHQEDPLWTTEFSFVYSLNENTVYYCLNHKYDEIHEYTMRKVS